MSKRENKCSTKNLSISIQGKGRGLCIGDNNSNHSYYLKQERHYHLTVQKNMEKLLGLQVRIQEKVNNHEC